MESFKHSCPFCGQHIEYTADYCGKKMDCPSCQKNVTFPAVPPRGKGNTLPIKRPELPKVKLSFDFHGVLAFIRQFEHWNIVMACVVPFVILVGLLVGASMLKDHYGSGPAIADVPIVHAEANAWQKMTDVARAEQVVQDKITYVTRANAVFVAAEQYRKSRSAYYSSHPPDYINAQSVSLQLQADAKAAANAQAALSMARASFDAAFRNYQKLGGTVDYRQQLPQ